MGGSARRPAAAARAASRTYARAHRIPLPPRPAGLHLLVCREDDERVFVVFVVPASALGTGAAAAASLVCVRANGGFAAAEQGMFLAMPPDLLRDAPGEGPDLMVRIDKAAPAGAASPTAPPASARIVARDA